MGWVCWPPVGLRGEDDSAAITSREHLLSVGTPRGLGGCHCCDVCSSSLFKPTAQLLTITDGEVVMYIISGRRVEHRRVADLSAFPTPGPAIRSSEGLRT